MMTKAKRFLYITTTFLLLLSAMTATTASRGSKELEAVRMARAMVRQSTIWVQSMASKVMVKQNEDGFVDGHNGDHVNVGLRDCGELYGESESRLSMLIMGGDESNRTVDDALTWLSGVLANHRSCLDGLGEMGLVDDNGSGQKLRMLVGEALDLYGKKARVLKRGPQPRPNYNPTSEQLLTTWNPATSRAEFVVSKDGSGTHTTINQAVAAVEKMGHGRRERVIIHVKAGVYNEKVEINDKMKNIMFVGDGIDRTIVTNNRNARDGTTTYRSATFGVSGDGFWARDMTFENTAGPQKHQAVALRVKSDLSVFYRCSFKGYQDTLFTHSLRQFYRDCHIYGTIDFIFGDAAVIFQNCDIFVRRPMSKNQANMITAQGRDHPGENTGISIQGCRVQPAPDFVAVQNSVRTYLGRPWKKYSRTVFMKTELGGTISPKGWMEWSGSFALSTLYYAEYLNTGLGASVQGRVSWPGFHVLRSPQEASPFSVGRFIQGESWIPVSGVPVSFDV